MILFLSLFLELPYVFAEVLDLIISGSLLLAE